MTLADIAAAAGLRTPIRHQLFIDGRFVDAADGQTLATLNPHDNSVIAEVAMAGREDVDRAVAAAERAFPAWARMAAAASICDCDASSWRMASASACAF